MNRARNEDQTELLKRLWPGMTEKQAAEAADNLTRYLGLILQMRERIESDPQSCARLYAQLGALTPP